MSSCSIFYPNVAHNIRWTSRTYNTVPCLYIPGLESKDIKNDQPIVHGILYLKSVWQNLHWVVALVVCGVVLICRLLRFPEIFMIIIILMFFSQSIVIIDLGFVGTRNEEGGLVPLYILMEG